MVHGSHFGASQYHRYCSTSINWLSNSYYTSRESFCPCCWTLQELNVYNCGGFKYCLNLGFRIASIILDFSLTFVILLVHHKIDMAFKATASYGSYVFAIRLFLIYTQKCCPTLFQYFFRNISCRRDCNLLFILKARQIQETKWAMPNKHK